MGEGKTPFGEWVKAGALKEGDRVSTRDSVVFTVGISGPRIAANDNQPLTITDIIRDNRETREYNLEVESRLGEITHNYFVGDDAVWVHNAGIGRNDPRLTWLYKLFGPDGKFLKWGITINPKARYPKKYGYKLQEQACGCRPDMLDLERCMVELDPGPMNHEPWAGAGVP